MFNSRNGQLSATFIRRLEFRTTVWLISMQFLLSSVVENAFEHQGERTIFASQTNKLDSKVLQENQGYERNYFELINMREVCVYFFAVLSKFIKSNEHYHKINFFEKNSEPL